MRKGLIVLGDLLDTDLIWMSKNGTLRTLAPGERIIVEGTRVTEFYIITEGSFDITTGGQTVARLSVGDILGEMSFVEKAGASADVTATTPARVLSLSQAALLNRFQEDHPFAARFYRALAVFLSDRLRAMLPGEAGQELDEGVLDAIHIAGDRMLRLIALLEGRNAI